MNHICRMYKINSTQQIIHYSYNMLLSKAVFLYLSKYTIQSLVKILHYQKNFIKLLGSIITLLHWYHNVNQFGSKKVVWHFS